MASLKAPSTMASSSAGAQVVGGAPVGPPPMTNIAGVSQLMTNSTIEPKEEFEDKLEKAEKFVAKVLEDNGGGGKETHEVVINYATRNPQVERRSS